MDNRIVWVDLEMTGLDIEKDRIIEIACVITDGDLNVIAEGPNLAINQPKAVMEEMNEWCKETHGNSGLTRRVLESSVSIDDAEKFMLEFLYQHTNKKTCPLAGNSVHVDKKFLEKFMPDFMSHLHYRIIDVSTVKELCHRWYPDDYANAPKKKGLHKALDDIRESIDELKFYRTNIFKK